MSTKKFNKSKKDFPVGRRLRTYLEEMGIKSIDLIKKTGIAPATVSEAINEKRDLTASKVELIVRHTDVDPMWLLTGQGGMIRRPDHESARHEHSRLYIPANEAAERKKLQDRICELVEKISDVYDLITLCRMAHRAIVEEPEASKRMAEELKNLISDRESA